MEGKGGGEEGEGYKGEVMEGEDKLFTVIIIIIMIAIIITLIHVVTVITIDSLIFPST